VSHDQVREAGQPGLGLPRHGARVGTKALADAGIDYTEVQQAYVGYVYGDSTAGQRAVYELGVTGIPIVNVNNNCSTGSTALFLAAQAIRSGVADCTLALGFEKMKMGSLGSTFDDRAMPLDRHISALSESYEVAPPMAAWMFGAAGREHMKLYGTAAETFARIGEKNHRHSVNNPYAQFQDLYTLEDILAAKMVYEPLTRLQCSPTSDGSAAAIIASERYVDEHGLGAQAVEIVGQAMTTDFASTFDDTRNPMTLVGADMSRHAARQAYEQAELGPEDVQVIELHDCFSVNELLTYEALGLCPEGEGGKLVEANDTTYGGRWVVKPLGWPDLQGPPARGDGTGPVRRADVAAKGYGGRRQVPGASAALQHNIGLGGAAVVTIYRPANR